MFFSTDIQMKTFIANSILSLVKNSTNNGVQSKDVSSTSEAVINLVSYSNVLQKAFKSKCNEVVNSRNTRERDYYFNMVGHCTIFARRTRDASGILERTRLCSLNETYEKL